MPWNMPNAWRGKRNSILLTPLTSIWCKVSRATLWSYFGACQTSISCMYQLAWEAVFAEPLLRGMRWGKPKIIGVVASGAPAYALSFQAREPVSAAVKYDG